MPFCQNCKSDQCNAGDLSKPAGWDVRECLRRTVALGKAAESLADDLLLRLEAAEKSAAVDADRAQVYRDKWQSAESAMRASERFRLTDSWSHLEHANGITEKLHAAGASLAAEVQAKNANYMTWLEQRNAALDRAEAAEAKLARLRALIAETRPMFDSKYFVESLADDVLLILDDKEAP